MNTDDFNLRRRYFGIINRCYNVNAKDYSRYGGKGVVMCQEWLDSFNLFKSWCLTNGYSKELEIDKDILCDKLGVYPKVYSPSTCMWITKSENSKYMHKSKVHRKVAQYSLKGNLITTYSTVTEAAKVTGVNFTNICRACNCKRDTAGDFQWKYVDDARVISAYTPSTYGIKVVQLDKETNEVLAVFASATEATKYIGKVKSSPITQVCTRYILPSGNCRTTAYGFKWAYLNALPSLEKNSNLCNLHK